MHCYSTEAEITALGNQIAAVHRDSEEACRSKGFFAPVFFGSSENYKECEYLNEHMSGYPSLIRLKDAAEIAFARYADGMGAIDRTYQPSGAAIQFLGGLISHNPVNAGLAFWRLLRHGGAVAQYDESSPLNRACSWIVKDYALVSVSPEGCALVRGKWWVFDYIRNSMLKCRAGIHLESIVEIDNAGEVSIIKDFRVD